VVFYTSLCPIISLTFFSAFCLSILSFPLRLIFHVTFLMSTSHGLYIFHPFLCSRTPTTLSLNIFWV
jgi:hypothetical protein